MKITFKPALDNSEQLNLRISPVLKQRIENLRSRSKPLGLDYNATLIAYIEDFVTESESQLDAHEQSASKSVAQQPPTTSESASKSVATPLPDSLSIAGSNGADPERA
jgi:hypothetical protein